MDPLVASVVVATSSLGVRLVGAVSLYLRLRWRVRLEQEHRQTLEAMARSLPSGSRFEDVHDDGSRLRLTVSEHGGDGPEEQV
jgi:hypothetical protein